MPRRSLALALAAIVCASGVVFAQGRIKQHGRSTVEFKSNDALAVVYYDFAQRNHGGPWLLLDFAIQTKPRIVIHRDQISLRGPVERVYRLASQQEFLEDQATLTRLRQNALVQRQPLGAYFTSPVEDSIHFFAWPRTIVQDTFVSNPDHVPAGELLFKSPDGKWAPGEYHLIVNHEQVKVDLPIELK